MVTFIKFSEIFQFKNAKSISLNSLRFINMIDLIKQCKSACKGMHIKCKRNRNANSRSD